MVDSKNWKVYLISVCAVLVKLMFVIRLTSYWCESAHYELRFYFGKGPTQLNVFTGRFKPGPQNCCYYFCTFPTSSSSHTWDFAGWEQLSVQPSLPWRSRAPAPCGQRSSVHPTREDVQSSGTDRARARWAQTPASHPRQLASAVKARAEGAGLMKALLWA